MSGCLVRWNKSFIYAAIFIIIIIISLTSIFFQDKSRVWTAASQQHLVGNQPLATFWDFPFSHSDASISRKSRLVTIRQLSIPGKVGASFWWRDALPHTNQLGLGKRRWNLEDLFSGSWISASVPCRLLIAIIEHLIKIRSDHKKTIFTYLFIWLLFLLF